MPQRWTIRIGYSTGDSFKSYETTGEVPITWEKLDVAKEGLARIIELDKAERYADHPFMWDLGSRKDEPKPPPVKECRGYPKEGTTQWPDLQIVLPLDDGTEQPIRTFWRGYFEHIRKAEIVPLDDPEMVYEP